MNTGSVVNGHYTFDGYTSTKISLDASTGLWTMQHLTDTAFSATAAMHGLTDYPVGLRNWTVRAPNGTRTPGVVLLNFNACDDAEDFTCHNGDCVAIERRCDGYNDCEDASDELACDKIIVPATYRNDNPIPPLDPKDELANVYISVRVLLVLDIKEVSSVFKVQFR